MVTNKQRHAVRFVVETLRIPFKGNINDSKCVQNFLSEHLDDAKLLKKQLEDIEVYYEEREMEWEARMDFFLQGQLDLYD